MGPKRNVYIVPYGDESDPSRAKRVKFHNFLPAPAYLDSWASVNFPCFPTVTYFITSRKNY